MKSCARQCSRLAGSRTSANVADVVDWNFSTTQICDATFSATFSIRLLIVDPSFARWTLRARAERRIFWVLYIQFAISVRVKKKRAGFFNKTENERGSFLAWHWNSLSSTTIKYDKLPEKWKLKLTLSGYRSDDYHAKFISKVSRFRPFLLAAIGMNLIKVRDWISLRLPWIFTIFPIESYDCLLQQKAWTILAETIVVSKWFLVSAVFSRMLRFRVDAGWCRCAYKTRDAPATPSKFVINTYAEACT